MKFLLTFFYLSDYREETQRPDKQQSVGVTEARPHSVREAGENLILKVHDESR